VCVGVVSGAFGACVRLFVWHCAGCLYAFAHVRALNQSVVVAVRCTLALFHGGDGASLIQHTSLTRTHTHSLTHTSLSHTNTLTHSHMRARAHTHDVDIFRLNAVRAHPEQIQQRPGHCRLCVCLCVCVGTGARFAARNHADRCRDGRETNRAGMRGQGRKRWDNVVWDNVVILLG